MYVRYIMLYTVSLYIWGVLRAYVKHAMFPEYVSLAKKFGGRWWKFGVIMYCMSCNGSMVMAMAMVMHGNGNVQLVCTGSMYNQCKQPNQQTTGVPQCSMWCNQVDYADSTATTERPSHAALFSLHGSQ